MNSYYVSLAAYIFAMIALFVFGFLLGKQHGKRNDIRDYHAERALVADYLEKFKESMEERDYFRADGAINML